MAAEEPLVASQGSKSVSWGRVVVVGGVDFATLGRKGKVTDPDRPDLDTPHLLRAISNVQITAIYASHSGCHAVFVDSQGKAHLLGRNDHGQLGDGTKEVAGEPLKLTAMKKAPVELREARIVHAGLGRSHTLLVTDKGHVYATGSNLYGAIGDEATKNTDVLGWKRVGGALLAERAIMAASGVAFSLVLCESGRVYAFGTGEKGVLGNGKTGEHIYGGKVLFIEQGQPALIRALENKKIVEIAAGQQHALARDNNGYVYSWGFGGLGRLGHGEQKDSFLPKPIHQFTHEREIMRAKKILCGPTCSIVLDGNGSHWLFGKFKVSGDGSAGQPWMSPRPIFDIQAYKMRLAGIGGSAIHFIANGDTPSELVPIAFGQNCLNGELGLGVGSSRSSTKPQRVETMDGLDIIGLASGQNTTYLLVRPPPISDQPDLSSSITKEDQFNDLPKFPPLFNTPEQCVVCNEEKADQDLLECEKCEDPTHLGCLDPPLELVPEGEYFCAKCQTVVDDADTPKKSGKRKAEVPAKANSKRKK